MALPVNMKSWPYAQAQAQPSPYQQQQQQLPPPPPFSPPPPYQPTPPIANTFVQSPPPNFQQPLQHTNSFQAPQHTNSFQSPQHTNSFPAPQHANTFPQPQHTGSFPQPPRNDSFPQPMAPLPQRPPENMFDGVMNVRCDLCSAVLDGIKHYHCQTCNDGDYDFCGDCYWSGRKCPCGAGDIIMLQFVAGHGRQLVDPSNYQGDSLTEVECESCHVKLTTGTHWACLACKMAEYHLCEGCYANEKRCPCGGFSTTLRMEFIPGIGRKPVAGAAQDYYGVPADPLHNQGDAAIQVADLIPPTGQVRLPHDNPRISALHSDIQLIVSRPTPSHQMMYIGDLPSFHRWSHEIYDPKVSSLKSMLTEIDALRTRLHAQSEESASLGGDSWAFLTPHLEIGDVLDLVALVERRAEDLYQEIQTMDELKIDLESTANATQYYQAGDFNTARQWEEYKEPTKKKSKREFHQERATRKKTHSEFLEKISALAHEHDTPQYDAVLTAISRIKALRTQSDSEVLDRALNVLRCARDSSLYIGELSFAARSEALQQEQVHGPMAEAQWQDQEPLLQHQRNIIAKIDQEKNTAAKAVQDHFVEFAEKPILTLLVAWKGAAAMNAATTPGATPGEPQKIAMPYSYYSNMMTSMHATQMQVMNNIAGGNTNFHVANGATGQVLW